MLKFYQFLDQIRKPIIGDQLIKDFDLDELLTKVDKLEKKQKSITISQDSIFDNEKFETIKRLVQADAITNVVQLGVVFIPFKNLRNRL